MAITPRIVIIDDHPALRDVLTQFFGADGYEVVTHPDAAEAVSVVQQAQPSLALIDLHLNYPLAGLDVVHALRADPATMCVPIVVWSSDPAVEYLVAAMNLPRVTALSKLADPALLRAAIARAAGADGQGVFGTSGR